MAICPSCQAQIEIGSEFFGGLFTCPQCKAVYFIGFDGTPESVSQQSSYVDVMAPPPAVENFSESLQQQPDPYQPMNEVSQPLNEQINDPMQPLNSYEASTQNEVSSSPVFSPLQDVVDFANTEGSNSLTSYSVEVSGLDLSTNLQAFKEVLTDSKLHINFDQIKNQIQNGRLKLVKLNPAQAAVLSFRLRPLQIPMKWEQSL